MSAGIDPDIMSSGIQLAGFHLEAGVQKFVDFVKAITADLSVSLEQIKPYYLCGWYNGARDLMKDSGLSIDGMDDTDQVRKDMEKLVAADKASQADQSMHLPKTRELLSDEDLLSTREERPDVYDAAVREYLEDYAEKFGDR